MREKKLDYFTALYNVAKVVNGSLDVSHILNQIVRSVTETMKVKACSLRLLDSKGQKLILGAYHGLSTYNPRMDWIPVTDRLPPFRKIVLACSSLAVTYFVAYVSP